MTRKPEIQYHMTKEEQFLSERIEKLRSVSERLQAAKVALEINDVCPESDLTHEEDPYNVGFIWASICNSLHSATDALNGTILYVEPGGLKETLEETELAKVASGSSMSDDELEKLEQKEEYKQNIDTTEKLDDDGK